MKVLIATDGAIDATAAAAAASRLAGDDGSVTVVTVIEVPRRLLHDMRAVYGEAVDAKAVDTDVEYVGSSPDLPGVGANWPGDDAIIQRFVDDQARQRTADVLEALEAIDTQATVVARESEDAASTLIELAQELSADVVCIGTRGLGRFEGLLGSVSSKVSRRAHCAVYLVRSAD